MDSAHTWRLCCGRINGSLQTRSSTLVPNPNRFGGADGRSAHGGCLKAPLVRTRAQLSPLLLPGVDLLAGAGSRPAVPPPGRFADRTV